MAQVLYELPEGWEWVDLLDASRIGAERGFIPEAVDGKVPFVGMSSIDQATGLNSTYETRNFEKVRKGYTKFQKNAVLLAKITPCTENNKTALMHDVNGGYATTEVYPVHPFAGTDPHYLLQFFRSPSIRKLLISKMEGATGRQRVPTNAVISLKIPHPPLGEQKRIVAKLDALFSFIDTAVTHLQETLELTKALFASALETVFFGLTDRVQIGDVADVKGGKRLPKGEKLQDDPSAHPYIRVADFTSTGSIDMGGLKYISNEIHEQIKRYTISARDLYISIAGTIGKTGIIPNALEGANLTENAAKLVFKEISNIEVRYVYYFTLSHDFSEQVGLATKVVAQPKLALTRLSKIKIPIPTIEVQRRIVTHLDALSQHTRALESATEEKLRDLASLKASLLNTAFMGQL